MQTQSLRHTHVDFRYCAALFSNLKSFAVQHSEHMALFFQDDEHFISIGEPNLPTAALDRGRRVLGHRAHAVAALDHDFTKAKLVPHQMTPTRERWWSTSRMESFLLHQHFDTLGNWITSSTVYSKQLLHLKMTQNPVLHHSFLLLWLSIVTVDQTTILAMALFN